jgi:hypothetical protein
MREVFNTTMEYHFDPLAIATLLTIRGLHLVIARLTRPSAIGSLKWTTTQSNVLLPVTYRRRSSRAVATNQLDFGRGALSLPANEHQAVGFPHECTHPDS